LLGKERQSDVTHRAKNDRHSLRQLSGMAGRLTASASGIQQKTMAGISSRPVGRWMHCEVK
jgi:hypothetical protein